jgi:RecA/RadA recombinase
MSNASEYITALNRIPTRISYLDRVLRGGNLARGVHGLLGPIGVGKTTLGTMIAVEGAQHQHFAGQSGRWVFVSIDERIPTIVSRAVSHGAQISRQLADQITPSATLEPERLSTEIAKLQRFMPVLVNHFATIDLSAEQFGGRTSPMQSIVDRIVQLECRVAGVVIDYAGIAVRRHVAARGFRENGIARRLSHFVAESRTGIARRFECPVWIIHQLNGEANRNSPCVTPHHRNAAGCRSFGKELDACITLGTMDRQSHCMLIGVTKAPADPEIQIPTVLSYHPQFATIVEDHLHRIDPMAQQIVSLRNNVKFDAATIAELERFGGGGNSNKPQGFTL